MNEKELIGKASRGDAAAFNALLGQHEKHMYATALRTCGNPEDAQDCLQTAMLRIWNALPGFKGESSFSTWAYRITVNTCLDMLRKKKNRPAVSADVLVEQGWMPVDPAMTPEEITLSRERGRVINEAILSLPDGMRQAVVLRDVEGYSYEDIAESLDINIGTVKSRISRAREKLREIILQKKELFMR